MSGPPNILAKARPRLVANQDFTHRISAAGLLHLKSFMIQRSAYYSKKSAEAVHQMRVAIRRLRTVVNILAVVTADEKVTSHNNALRNFMRVLGHARDQDVLIAMLQKIPSSFHHDLDMQETAVYTILDRRNKAYLQIDEALQDSDLNNVFHDLITLFQARAYTLQEPFQNTAHIDALILDQIHRTVVRRGRKLSDQDLNQKHRLRLSLKQLRYALEFLALNRATSTRSKTYRKSVERLLDHLGATNDAFTASRIAHESLDQPNGEIHIMSGMIAGWYGRGVEDSKNELIKSWKKFKSLSPYWN